MSDVLSVAGLRADVTHSGLSRKHESILIKVNPRRHLARLAGESE
jgi:hypothetical protein